MLSIARCDPETKEGGRRLSLGESYVQLALHSEEVWEVKGRRGGPRASIPEFLHSPFTRAAGVWNGRFLTAFCVWWELTGMELQSRPLVPSLHLGLGIPPITMVSLFLTFLAESVYVRCILLGLLHGLIELSGTFFGFQVASCICSAAKQSEPHGQAALAVAQACEVPSVHFRVRLA